MKLTKKTQAAIKNYGELLCATAYRRNLEGDGANTIGFENGLTTRQADAAIDAGQELAARDRARGYHFCMTKIEAAQYTEAKVAAKGGK